MEFVDGKILSEELKADRFIYPKCKFLKLKEQLYHCGRWLRHFQTITGLSKAGRGAIDSIEQRLESRLNLIQELADPRIPEWLPGETRKQFRTLIGQIGDSTLLLSGRHGDFSTFNILANEQGITVIDFLGYEKDFIAVDLLKMLVDLHDEKLSITSSNRRVNDLRESFLEGYGELPPIVLPAVVACEMMQRTVSLAKNILYSRKLPHSPDRESPPHYGTRSMAQQTEKTTVVAGCFLNEYRIHD